MDRDRRTRRALGAILLLGLALRLYGAWRWNVEFRPGPGRLASDGPGYDGLARDLLAGYGLTWPGRTPAYPAFLAALHRIFGAGVYAAVPFVQGVIGLGTIVLAFVLGRRLFGRFAGLVAALLAATSYVLIQHGFHHMTEILFAPAVLLVAVTLERAIRAPGAARFLHAGFWVGASCLIRPTLFLFPLAAIPVLALALDARRAVRYAAIYLAAAALVIAPWTVRNYVKYDTLLPLATSNALLWQGSPEYYHLLRDEGYTVADIWARVLYPEESPVPYPGEIDGERYWRDRAWRSIRAEPAVYLRYSLEKTATYWTGDPEVDWAGRRVFDYGALATQLPTVDALQLFVSRLVPLAALLAAGLLWRERRRLPVPYALLVYATLLHATTHAEARLSEPFQPLLFVVIGGAIAVTAGRHRPLDGPWRRDTLLRGHMVK